VEEEEMRRRAVLLLVGLTLALVPLSGAEAGGCHPKSLDPSSVDASESRSTTVPIKGCRFSATLLYVDPGTQVTWTNEDLAPHTVTGFSFGSGDELLRGDTVAYRFDEEGVYPYSCTLHPGMNGAIVVGDGVGKITQAAVASAHSEPPKDPPRTQEESSGGIDSTDALLISGVLAAVVGAAGLGAVVVRRRAKVA
jgi:plastocyanin